MTTIKITKKDFRLFLENVSFFLSEEVSGADLNSIQKTVLNLKFMGDKSQVLKKLIDLFQANVLADLKALVKAKNTTPEEVQQVSKLVNNFGAAIALSFDKNIMTMLSDAPEENSVRDSLGEKAQELINSLTAKMTRYSETINAGAQRASQRVSSIKLDPQKYSLSPMAIKSIVSDTLAMSVGDYKESLSDANSFLEDVGLKGNQSIPPPSIPPTAGIPPTNPSLDEPTGEEQPVQPRHDVETIKPMLFNPNQATGAVSDIVDFWNKLTPRQRAGLSGLKQILAKHKIVS